MLFLFHHGDGVAPAVELVGGGQARRAGAHHADLFAGPLGRTAALHVAAGEGVLNDAQLVVPDGDGAAVDAADAGLLAGGGTDPAGELREVVGFQQAAQGVGAVAAHDHVVPLGDEVVERTAKGLALVDHAGLAEGDAAVHAAAALLGPHGVGEGNVEFLPVADPLGGGAGGVVFSDVL